MDFSRAPLTFLIPWPLAVLAGAGLAAIVIGIGFGLYDLFGHISWH